MRSILGTSKIHQNRIVIPKDVRKRFHLNNIDRVVWIENDSGELVIQRPKRRTNSDEIVSI